MCLLTLSFLLFVFFVLGFSIRCEPTAYTGFCQGNKNGTRRKSIFPFRLRITVKRRIVICSYTLDIKTPFQFTTLNVKGAACDLFDVSMGIYLRKYWSYSLNAVSRGKRVIYHGKKSPL